MANRDWVRFNEDSKAKKWRELKVQQDGGKFIRTRRGWEWTADVVEEVAAPKPATKKKKKK